MPRILIIIYFYKFYNPAFPSKGKYNSNKKTLII
jgi:hypothetical protein